MAADADIELKLLLEAIFHRYHYDFRSYSLASIQRRLVQATSALGCTTLSGLQERCTGRRCRSRLLPDNPSQQKSRQVGSTLPALSLNVRRKRTLTQEDGQ
jgi:hypothetical protein